MKHASPNAFVILDSIWKVVYDRIACGLEQKWQTYSWHMTFIVYTNSAVGQTVASVYYIVDNTPFLSIHFR